MKLLKKGELQVSTIIIFILAILVLIVMFLLFREYIVNALTKALNFFRASLISANSTIQNMPKI